MLSLLSSPIALIHLGIHVKEELSLLLCVLNADVLLTERHVCHSDRLCHQFLPGTGFQGCDVERVEPLFLVLVSNFCQGYESGHVSALFSSRAVVPVGWPLVMTALDRREVVPWPT